VNAASVCMMWNIRKFVSFLSTSLQVGVFCVQCASFIAELAANQPPVVYTFFDCETTQETGKHLVNFVVSHTQCANCMNADVPFDAAPIPGRQCLCPPVKRHHFENFDGQKAPPLEQFLDMVTKKRQRQTIRHICIAHNSSRFDTHLVFEAAVNQGHTPKMIQKGLKIFK
jgi:hypothetical protein